MDGLGRAIGDGLSGLVGGAIDTLGSAFGGIVDTIARVMPGGLLGFAIAAVAAVLVLRFVLR